MEPLAEDGLFFLVHVFLYVSFVWVDSFGKSVSERGTDEEKYHFRYL